VLWALLGGGLLGAVCAAGQGGGEGASVGSSDAWSEEGGVRIIEVSHNLGFVNGTGWDTHNEGQLKQHLLIDDLDRGHSDDAVCRAVVDTVLRWDIPVDYFTAFLHSMRMDLTVTEYADYPALYEYVYGSAAVIGLQMIPILEPSAPEAFERAKDLGVAFQLANFVRDVGEDLDRGRVYLPLDELAACGVTRGDLEARVATPAVKDALRFQIARVRELSLNPKVGIMVGGSAIVRHPEWVERVGADGTAANGPAAVILAKKLFAASLA
jgi:hypothetical protein